MAQRKGRFIALEGIDNSGKTTQREIIGKYFADAGFEVVYTREPGGTPFAELIRDLILRPRDENVSAKTELLLFFASREQHLQEVIIPAVERGAVVICDRFVDSTYAYQAAGGGVEESFIVSLEQQIVGDNGPDLTFTFTVSPEIAAVRAASQGELDAMESKGPEYYKRAQDKYVELALESADRYQLVNGDLAIDQVTAQMIPKLMELVNDMRKRITPEAADAADGCEKKTPLNNTPKFWADRSIEILPGFNIVPQSPEYTVPAELIMGKLAIEYTTERLDFVTSTVPFGIETNWTNAQLTQLDMSKFSSLVAQTLRSLSILSGNIVDLMVMLNSGFVIDFSTHYRVTESSYPSERVFTGGEIGDSQRLESFCATSTWSEPVAGHSYYVEQTGRKRLEIIVDPDDRDPVATIRHIVDTMFPKLDKVAQEPDHAAD